MIAALWIIVAVFLLVITAVAFSLPWTKDTIEEWIDRYTDDWTSSTIDLDGWAEEFRRDARDAS